LSIYPNPVLDNLNLKSRILQNSTFKIYDIQCKIYKEGQIGIEKNSIAVRSLETDLYLLQLHLAADQQVIRFIKN
jgi:hypothetical protein